MLVSVKPQCQAAGSTWESFLGCQQYQSSSNPTQNRQRASYLPSGYWACHHQTIQPVPALLGSCDRLCDFYFLKVHLLLLYLQLSVHISASLNVIHMAGGHFDVMEDIWKTIADSLKQI